MRFARYFLPALLLVAGLDLYFTRDWLRTVSPVLIRGLPLRPDPGQRRRPPWWRPSVVSRGAAFPKDVRGGTVLQNAAKVDSVFFDKTGTLTEGRFGVIKGSAGKAHYRKRGCGPGRHGGVRFGACAGARHPGRSAASRVLPPPAPPDEARIVPGRGAVATIAGHTIRAGNAGFLAEHNIFGLEPLLEEADRYGATAVLVAENDAPGGNASSFVDRVREGARRAIHELRAFWKSPHLTMLTGDLAA